MSPYGNATTFDFALVGNRSYVRSTDVLRVLLDRLPARNLTVKFLRPITGSAILIAEPSGPVAVAISAGGRNFGLENAASASPVHVATRPAATAAIRFRVMGFHVFLFTPSATIADRVERCFDIVHPELGETYVVRSIRIVSPFARIPPILWFRIHRTSKPASARLTMRTPLGRLAEISFKVRPKRNDTP